ncbi:SRPBCC domain-containing protein, partial [Micromonospora sp. M51]|uniref:SRPBCC domain-containing protein n=1 Tax=Micromonospora sp. M51 TaxID=2824889 RepID=UPI001B35F9DF
DPPRRLSYSFKHQKFEELRGEPISRVVFTIEPFGSLVRLTVLHDGFVEGGKYLGAVSNGWPAILSGLKSLLETGKAPQIKMAPPAQMLAALKAMGIRTP